MVGCVVLLLLPLLVVVKKVTGSGGWCNCRVNLQSLRWVDTMVRGGCYVMLG